VGCSVGTSFVDMTDPLRPRQVGFLRTTDTFSYWRDVKVYGHHVYIGSESSRHGVQVLDLGMVGEDAAENSTGLEYAATHVYYGVGAFEWLSGWLCLAACRLCCVFCRLIHSHCVIVTRLVGIAVLGCLSYPAGSSHNLFVHEESGYLYVLGSNECRGGLHVADLQSSPAEPTFVTCYAGAGYMHDIHCVMYHGPDSRYTGREICVAFTGVDIRILDVTEKCSIVVVTTATYGGRSFVHQGWWTADHRYFIMGDENDEVDYGMNTRSLLWDAADLTSLSVAHEYFSNTGAVDHNQYVHGGLVWQSNYCSGLQVLNITAGRLSPAGHFDVSISCPSSNPWLGSWSNYPFFSSGNIAVASIEMGMFILKVIGWLL